MTSAGKPLLSVSALGVSVRTSRLLHDISFALQPGEILALLGANGAGKSTLIAALAGEIGNPVGSILFDGALLTSWSLRTLAERRALNVTEPAVPFALSVADYVALGRPFDAVDDYNVQAALAEADATQWAVRDIATLSSGEQTRVQLARSLYQLGDTPHCLWLLDEPCAHLDLAQKQFVLALILRIAKARKWGIVFSTHDPAEALQIADQALLLQAGTVVASGVASEVINAENLSRCYGVNINRSIAFIGSAG